MPVVSSQAQPSQGFGIILRNLGQDLVEVSLLPRCDHELTDDPRPGRMDFVLHLHRFQHQ